MLFGKKEEKTAVKTEVKPKVEPYDIHVMPEKFHKFLAVKKRGLGRLVLILGIIVVVLSGIAFGAFYFMNQLDKEPSVTLPPLNLNRITPAPVNENTNANINANANENLNQVNANVNESEANENVNQNNNINENDNTNVNVNENVNTNTNGNFNLNVPPVPPVITYSSSLDADKDDLTDIEEELYQVEKRKPDTDADGYIDGQEIINGFNPKAAGSSFLETSGLVNKYTNPTFNYEILHPAAWLARPTDQSLAEVIFQSATGEYVQVLIGENPESLDLVNWYLTQSPLTDIRQLERKTTKNGYDALISPDKLTYYLVDKNKAQRVYILTYNIGNKTRINFLTTFQMMINSFKLVSSTAAATGTNTEIITGPEVPQ